MMKWLIDLFTGRNFGAARSPIFQRESKLYRKEQPLCEFGWHKPTLLNPLNTHHVRDFSTFPEEENLKENWMNVCRFHHFFHCHLGDWKSINPDVRVDARIFSDKVRTRR